MRLSSVAAVLLLAAGLFATVMAGVAFHGLAPVETVLIPVDRAAIASWRGSVHGSIEAGLPFYRLLWDGQPPKAEVIDTATGEVLAPSVLSRATLEVNRQAALWSQHDDYLQVRERCEFLLPPEVYAERRARLALRFQVPPPRAPFYAAGALAAALFALAWLARRAGAVARAPAAERLGALLRLLPLLLYLGLAGICFVTQFPGSPWLSGDTDVASINSFAAALDHPALFAHDRLLDDPHNFTWYTPLYVAAARAVRALGFPYDVSKSIFAFVGTLLGLLGYDRLFTRISRSRLFGILGTLSLALLLAAYPPDEHWAFSQVRPRTLFTALLPWVLLLALRVRTRPWRWWIAAAAAALLFYIHPVSSPALSAALLLGFFFSETQGRKSLGTRLAAGVAAAAVSFVLMVPYAVIYAAGRVPAASRATLAELVEIKPRFAPGVFYADCLRMLVAHPRFWLLLAVLAFLSWQSRGDRRGLGFFWGALGGYSLVIFVLPAVDWQLAAAARRLPFQTDLVRGVRYLDVWLVASLALAVRLAADRHEALGSPGLTARLGFDWQDRPRLAGSLHAAPAALAGSLLLLGCYGGSMLHSLGNMVAEGEANLRLLRGRPSEVPLARLELVRALDALRRPGELTAIPDDLDFLRQLGVPLTAMWKDPITLSYANPEAMRAAQSALERARPILAGPVDAAAARRLAAILEADLVVLERERAALSLYADPVCLFANSRYLLLRPGSKALAAPTDPR